MIKEEIIYGLHAVEEFVSSYPEKVNKVLLSSPRPNLERLLRTLGVPFQKAPLSRIESLCPKVNHQGVIALVSPLPYHDIEDISSEEKIILALDGIEDPQNVGAILRTAEAAGIKSVIIPSRRSAPITSTAIKASSGAAIRLKVIRTNSLPSTLEKLKGKGFWIVGSEINGALRYDTVDYPFPSILVLGSEGKGIHRTIQKLCDLTVFIPIYGKVQSLNVSVAAGIILYEMLKKIKN